jgi:hypothetical protein
MSDYEKTIAEIERTIAYSGDRINGFANNVNRAINLLMTARPGGLNAVECDVLLSFEALCVESLWRTAWLFHQRHEHDAPAVASSWTPAAAGRRRRDARKLSLSATGGRQPRARQPAPRCGRQADHENLVGVRHVDEERMQFSAAVVKERRHLIGDVADQRCTGERDPRIDQKMK